MLTTSRHRMPPVPLAYARVDPLAFASRCSAGLWKNAKHLSLIGAKLREVADGRLKRLIVNMPPRHGKSQLLARWFPAWWQCRHPNRRIIISTHTSELAEQHGRKVRDIIGESGAMFSPPVAVNDKSRSAGRWDIKGREGGMYATGIGSAVVGFGADLLIVDDFVRNAEAAFSKHQRDKVWDWWQSEAFQRVEPGGAIVILATRWHEDDLIGRLIKQTAESGNDDEQWSVLRLPAIAEADDPLGRAPGEALWPERWPLRDLAAKRAGMSPYFWSAQFQQRPVPEAGMVIRREWFRRYERDRPDSYSLRTPSGHAVAIEHQECERFLACDPASTETDGKESSWSVVACWSLYSGPKLPAPALILDGVARAKVNMPDFIRLVVAEAAKWRPAWVGCENAGIGLAAVQMLRNTSLQGGGSLPVRELPTRGQSKVIRAQDAITLYSNGRIYHPNGGAAWLDDFESELTHWAGRDSDVADQVDVAAYAARHCLAARHSSSSAAPSFTPSPLKGLR